MVDPYAATAVMLAGEGEAAYPADETTQASASSYLEPGFTPAGGRIASSKNEAAVHIAPGMIVNRYRIVRMLGQGGQGRIFLATDLERDVHIALKTMRNIWLNSEPARQLFRREALAIAPLVHPHIVRLYHAFEHEGLPFIAMEYVAGRTFAEAMRRRQLGNRDTLDIFMTCCKAMDYAHDRGIVHLDLKPQNILLTHDNIPKIADFGIARNLCRLKELRCTAPDNPEPGLIAGSPAYMAPEQAANQPELVGPRTDVYALGAMLYKIFTGRAPHVAETPRLTLQCVLYIDPEPPMARNPSVGWNLNAICMKALARNPKERYATPGEMAADLQHLLD